MKRQSFIVIKDIPTLLNRLYIPICRNNKPSIIKNKDAKKFIELVRIEAMKQKCINIMEGDVSMKIDFCIAKLKGRSKEPDIDSCIKLLLDSLEGIMYKDDKQIKSLHIVKHIEQEESEIVVMVEEIL